MLKLIVVAISVALVSCHHNEDLHTASAYLQAGDVKGTVTFTELENGLVRVDAKVTGMAPGLYGFHVHEKGDLSGGCASTGSHFNPNQKKHGHPHDEERHVGDLGNLEFNQDGDGTMNYEDKLLALRGPNNILGRAVVLHAKTDDYGRSDHPDSKKTGNAGGRVACGVIGLLAPVYGAHSSTAPITISWTLILLTPLLRFVIFN